MSINRISQLFSIFYHLLKYNFISIIERMFYRLKGVRLGNGIRFYGFCRLYRKEGSTITIGNRVQFVSSSYVNHIGLNRKCSISTEEPDSELIIGDGCGFSSTNIIAFKSIRIGNNVRVGANTVIMDSDFHLDDPRIKPASPIVIDDNVWIGANVVVLKGVHIGENSVIGMNSVVTKDIPANCIAAGNPCKVLQKK